MTNIAMGPDHKSRGLPDVVHNIQQSNKKASFVTKFDRLELSWGRLFVQTVLAAYSYAFMEWLFFVTKPSFMDALPFGKKLEVFLLTGLIVSVFVLPCLIMLRLLGWIPGPTRKWQVFPILGALLPALLTTMLSLLLIDNFTYTVFSFGIVTSQGVIRGVYAVLVVGLLVVWYRYVLLGFKRQVAGAQGAGSRRSRVLHIQYWLAAVLVVFSLGVGLVRIAMATSVGGETNILVGRRPHIILLGGDGIRSHEMSLYGYERDTTPYLLQLAETSLLAENNYTNASHSTGSDFSILTGKYPAQTQLMYLPNILHGEDAYQHLPGILQRAGYATYQIAFPYYVDAYTVNLQDGFDEVNGRSINQGGVFSIARQFHFEDVRYFLPQLSDRIFNRLQHILFIRKMPDPYRTVLQAVDSRTLEQMTDQERIDKVIQLLREAQQPLFVHIHLMETHGPTFSPRKRVFSAGKRQDQAWMQDFYDDAVLDFDSYVGEVLDELEESGLDEQTVVVIYSDHDLYHQVDDRIPLLFHFPEGEFAGRIQSNTQNLDIAPTLLDYLGMDIPSWMSGQSLLTNKLSSTRPIISAGVVDTDCSNDGWCEAGPSLAPPPFYQISYLQVIVCQRIYTLTLSSNTWAEGGVTGHTAPCDPEALPNGAEIRKMMLGNLTGGVAELTRQLIERADQEAVFVDHLAETDSATFFDPFLLNSEVHYLELRQCLPLSDDRPTRTTYLVVLNRDSHIADELETLYPQAKINLLRKRDSGLEHDMMLIEIPPQTSVSPTILPGYAEFEGGFDFLGYNWSDSTVNPGEDITITLYWKSLVDMDADHTAFLHIGSGFVEQPLVAQHDGTPCQALYPTSQWHAGDIVADKFTVTIPEDAPLGEYPVAIGWYSYPSLERLPLTRAEHSLPDNRAIIANLKIMP